MKPKVSVIIPVYNTANYLPACLDSVVNQTLREIEIICVDDGSTDGSPGILNGYKARDGRITVLTQPNANAGVARNRGLELASGKYLAFLDSDDFFEPAMLATAYGQAERQSAEIVVFRCDAYRQDTGNAYARPDTIIKENLPPQVPFAGTEVKKDLFGTFKGWAWDKLFLREFILQKGLRFQEQRTTNDLFFTYMAMAEAGRIITIEDVLAHHRVHTGTSLEATRERSWDCFYKALCCLRQGLRNAGFWQRFERDFINYSASFAYWHLKTLPWPAQETVFHLLKNIWLEDLGVPGHDSEYFYSREEYDRVRAIMCKPYTQVFPAGGLQNTLVAAKGRIAQLEKDLQAIRRSRSYRIGRAITYLPRKICGWIRRLKQHGLKDTLKHMVCSRTKTVK